MSCIAGDCRRASRIADTASTSIVRHTRTRVMQSPCYHVASAPEFCAAIRSHLRDRTRRLCAPNTGQDGAAREDEARSSGGIATSAVCSIDPAATQSRHISGKSIQISVKLPDCNLDAKAQSNRLSSSRFALCADHLSAQRLGAPQYRGEPPLAVRKVWALSILE